MKIPFKKLDFSRAIPRVNELLKSGFIGLGNDVGKLEEMLADYLGCKYVIATDSCTSALFISLRYESNLHNYVIIPSMTVPLVANAVIEAKEKLYFNDSVKWVGSAYRLVNTHVIDSAHAMERNMMKNFKNDSQIKFCFSFYPTKPLGSADGGCIATNNEFFYKWAKEVICYGRNQEGTQFKNSWEYDTVRVGYKRHYTNLQAAIVISQLEILDDINERRKKIRDKFNEAFQLHNSSLYLYRLNVPDRNDFIKLMAAEGIECGVHFKPLHMMSAFRNIPFYYGNDQNKVEKEYESTVSIPFYNSMTEDEQDFIINRVINFYSGIEYVK